MGKVYSTTVTRDVNIDVEFNVIPGSKGARDSLGGVANAGPALEPDTEAEVEITKVTNPQGLVIELDEIEQAEISQEILESLGDEEGPQD